MLSMNYFDLFRKFTYAGAPTFLVFSVTGQCNARCGICFYHGHVNQRRNELTLPEIERFSRKFGPLLSLVLTGGEPFMRQDLPEICKIFYKNNDAFAINISTNGFFSEQIEKAARQILRDCKKAVLSIDLSIDDLGEKHDRMRGLPDAFNKMLDTHDRLLKLKKSYPNLWVKANTTFCAYNQDRMGEIRKGIKRDFNFDDHSISLIIGNPRDSHANKISLEAYAKSVRQYEKEKKAGSKGLIERLLSILRTEVHDEILRSVYEKTPRFKCTALKKVIFIDEVGDLYPCGMIKDSLGSLRENGYDPRKIMRSSRAREVAAQQGIHSGCYCQWDCGIFNNIVYDSKNYPRILKRLLTGL
jgi:MoaA/NifB/PqqE/SkfB family radical SAM enzyme